MAVKTDPIERLRDFFKYADSGPITAHDWPQFADIRECLRQRDAFLKELIEATHQKRAAELAAEYRSL